MILFTGTRLVNACIIKIFLLMKETLTHQFSFFFNLLNTNLTKWSNTLKQFVGKLPTNCLSMFDHFVGLVLKRLIASIESLCLLFYSWLLDANLTKWSNTLKQFISNLPTICLSVFGHFVKLALFQCIITVHYYKQ